MKRTTLALSLLTILSTALYFAETTTAETGVFRAVVDDYISLELNDENMAVDVAPGTPFASGYVTATVNTNAAAGYTLTFQDADNRNGLEREGYDGATDKSPYNIPSVSADTAYANLAADTWGYFLGNTTATEATYKQIPLTSTEVASSDEPADDAVTRVNFGVKIAGDRPSGLYQDTLVFTLTSPPITPPVTFDDAYFAAGKTKDAATNKYKLQDMTPSICNEVSIDEVGQLVDVRDGTIYNVGKLKDARCWLQDNLALDLTNATVQANMNPSNTNANTTALNALFNGGRVSGDTSTNNLATAGVADWTSGYSYSAPLINKQYKDTTYSEDPLDATKTSKYGIYYNYCAASAGSYCYGSGTSSGTSYDRPDTLVDAEYDICPSGWRMPTSTSSGEYQALWAAYPTVDSVSQINRFRTALLAPLSGYYNNGSAYYQGSYGFFWSSTRFNGDYMYSLVVYSSGAGPSGSLNRYTGYSVRCIASY